MRMRKKKHAGERIEAIKEYLLDDLNKIDEKQPLHMEIGCGKGAFITQLAAKNPDINYIAVEKISSVMVLAMEKAAAAQLKNVKFLLGDVVKLADIEKTSFCDRIYLNFSDPWPRKKHAKRRLTAPQFLDIYKKMLTDGGEIHMKTDNRTLFEYSLETLPANGFELNNVTFDLHADNPADNIMTEYEKNFSEQGMPIHRLEGKLK
ncbi:MAG: tRNA (guanosine(46)-N7)-methyltransferase TrmB [Clostridia bacterium]|nr:tRNA (guanosine(46)-N7)-methyltransferase TrmB [Clostridia bacterium]